MLVTNIRTADYPTPPPLPALPRAPPARWYDNAAYDSFTPCDLSPQPSAPFEVFTRFNDGASIQRTLDLPCATFSNGYGQLVLPPELAVAASKLRVRNVMPATWPGGWDVESNSAISISTFTYSRCPA